MLGQQNQTDLERWLQPTPHSPDQGVIGNIGTGLSNIGAAGLNALTHPEQLVTGALSANPLAQGYQDVKNAVAHLRGQPNPTDEAGQHPVQTALQTGEAFAGQAGALGGPKLAGDLASQVGRYVRPTSSPLIVPQTEMAARNLATAILPATKDSTNFIQAAQQEVPNVLDYAKRTGNPLNTQLEFSKAAQGYAQEVRSLYQDKILGPVADQSVKTTGTGFGSRTGEGPDTSATLGNIDQRITSINTQLDKPSLNADDARRALASQTDLQSEAARLRVILHQNLSASSGLPPDQIADLRQRVGRSYELANDTNAAVTARMQSAGAADLKPVKVGEIPGRAINLLRGGPVPIADRAFQNAIANFPGQAQPLPAVTPAQPQVSPASMRLDQLMQTLRQQRVEDGSWPYRTPKSGAQ
jgi:hypothetical protein